MKKLAVCELTIELVVSPIQLTVEPIQLTIEPIQLTIELVLSSIQLTVEPIQLTVEPIQLTIELASALTLSLHTFQFTIIYTHFILLLWDVSCFSYYKK